MKLYFHYEINCRVIGIINLTAIGLFFRQYYTLWKYFRYVLLNIYFILKILEIEYLHFRNVGITIKYLKLNANISC